MFHLIQRNALGLLCALLLSAVALGAIPEGGPPQKPAQPPVKFSEFYFYRVGKEMQWFTSELARKLNLMSQKRKDGRPLHLVLVLDTSTSNCRLLEEFDKSVADLLTNGPKGLTVSVVALRNQPAVVSAVCTDKKELRTAIRKIMDETKNSQMRAQVALNPAQRRQIQAWDNLVFITPDDCVKDWCGGVRFCLKEFAKNYQIDAICVMTLDNADTENNVEGLAAELKAANVTFFAAAPETILTTGDPLHIPDRLKFYSKCKEELKMDYGAEFIFHRRESAVNEVIPVSGLNGPMECVGCPTGYGYYGLARAGYATDGMYFIIADKSHPQCACIFHAPGDRLGRGLAANLKPGPLLGADGKEKVAPAIRPYEFDSELQAKYQPSLLSRDEVFGIYQSSPYYRYLFSLRGRQFNGNGLGYVSADPNNNLSWSWDEGKYLFGAWQVTPWGGEGKAAAAASPSELPMLRIYADERHPPSPWNYNGGQNGLPGGYAAFYTAEGVEACKTYLDGAIKSVEGSIESARANMPKDEPTKVCHRAIAEIEYFILCLENQLFYLKQYRYYLNEMANDPAVKAVFDENKNEDEARKKREEVAKNKVGRGVSYIEIRMPRLLKQRCEDFDPVMEKRPPLYGGGEGRASVMRFIKARQEMNQKIKLSTWTNFFKMGWQRQYWFIRIDPVYGPGGGGEIPPPKVPTQPVYAPPAVPPQPSPSAPDY